MADIKMIKYHSLPMAQARALVQKAADDLAEEYELSSHWAGNTLHFRRSGVQGEMRVSESEIDLEVTLGFLLKAFKARFVEHIEHNFDTLLAKAHAAHKPSSAKGSVGKTPAAHPAKSSREGGATKAGAANKVSASAARKAPRKA
jgi:putative polyhydroxyalkanoate system protein